MNHSFDVDIASKYGIEEAILIENMAFWIIKNQENNKNIKDGVCWTYNSAKSLAELFPYINERTLSRKLKKLEELKIISISNFNRVSYDRTNWYSIIDDEICLKYGITLINTDMTDCQMDKTDCQMDKTDCQMDMDKMTNGDVQNDKWIRQNDLTIPDINTDINADINTDISIPKRKKKKSTRFVKPSLDEIKQYCLDRGNNVDHEKFYYHYESNGWKVGKNNMKNWRAAISTWERNTNNFKQGNSNEKNKPDASGGKQQSYFQKRINEAIPDDILGF